VLREVGELGSVTAAAEALLVTPSAISQQLRLLQRSIPVPLTERDGRRVVLTAAGRALAAAAADVESALARARHTVDEFIEQPDALVSVAAFHSAAATFFPLLLRADGAPQLSLHDEDVPQDEFPLLTREYDVVLAHRLDHGAAWPGTVGITPLLHEPLDVALPVDHPLAAKRQLTPRDVAHEPWITVHDGFPLMATIEAIGAAAGRNDFGDNGELVDAMDQVEAMVGGGIALMPRWTARRHPAVVLRPLRGVHARRHIDALHRPERTARQAVRTVLTTLQQAASTLARPRNAGQPRSR
jgi:DNA-binding transcriptional LysR family regulator